ncbi:4Fe-4S dicluster domain-containing protein [Candidatus Formimonas warabiya]|uniref:4Fe-4S ferredoxin n=1 Tax=Formimonas warabiya TaxID=1761012 RepID=A0A3G1KMK5_FORW1|nr:4Fe-4S dicluster domain-containing protein [Candidatus Formimonas warabiya]ATW23644.1 4Fe-4S ferredoxin [Candidatus Formimonas warabiya]
MHWGMLMDLRKCVGCYACTIACQNEHNLPFTVRWNKIMKMGPVGNYPNLTSYSVPVPCMHCQDAPCANGCPTGASMVRKDGVVLVDRDKCVGCKFCLVLCPYGVRHYNEEKGIVEKCTFCMERLEEGRVTRCVETCQLKARYCGDLDDPDSEIVQLMRKHNAKPLYEELGTKPSVYYIMP